MGNRREIDRSAASSVQAFDVAATREASSVTSAQPMKETRNEKDGETPTAGSKKNVRPFGSTKNQSRARRTRKPKKNEKYRNQNFQHRCDVSSSQHKSVVPARIEFKVFTDYIAIHLV